MGKRIIQQRRGRGTSTYRVSKKSFKYKVGYPVNLSGEGTVVKLLNSSAHSYPLAKIKVKKTSEVFYIPAFKGMVEGQKINFDENKIQEGNILKLKDIPVKIKIYNIESRPGDGGVFIRSGGSSANITKIVGDNVFLLMPSKKEKKFNKNCRTTIGVVAGAGRLEKPIVKAGKKYHLKKAKSKLWPRTSAVKMNVIDHPFGSGRAKNPKSKVAKRNAPPGKKVGLIRPKRTGKRK
ncbi:50S ribosomal protein L2 [Candidatus Pacearchaeota archaeon]|nr:50S ribosomal protein L2 [Candidatus Pacearchaeota archaeon]